MLSPVTYDATGRVKTTTAVGGTAPSTVNGGIATSAAGRILMDSNAPSGAIFNGALCMGTTNGNLFVATAPAGTDQFVNGLRVSAAGALVCAVEGTPVVFNAGLGFLADGSLCTTEV